MKLYKLLSFFLLLHIGLISQNAVVYNDPDQTFLINGSHISILEDKTNELKTEAVMNSKDFKPVAANVVPNCGVSKSTFWIMFNIKNESNDPQLLLNLSYPNLNNVELHLLLPDTHLVTVTGKRIPISERSYHYPGYLFDLKLEKHATVKVLLKINSGGQIMAPVFVGTRTAILDTVRSENLFVGIYSGVMLIMFFYNIFIYFTVRDKIYLYYVLYILIVGLVQLCLLGYTSQFIWPNSIWLIEHSVYLLSPLSGIVIIEFIKVFLRTKEFTPKLHKGFYFISAVYWIYIILDLFNLGDELYNIIQLFAMILSFYILVVSFRIMRKKYRPAKFLFYAWLIFLVGVFVYALKDVGVLPYNTYTIYTMPIGSAIETALLSFALADRINILKLEKEESQAKALELLTENERIIREQNIQLETKVKERTAELEASNKTLKEAEANLINAEKMASLGQLTAGISHEINNPINFVASNIKPLKRDIEEITFMLSKYSEIKDGNEFGQKQKDLDELRKKLDIDYLTEEINLLLKGIDEGANRTAEIVRGLKTFARADETDLKKINVHEGIDATLGLLNSNLLKEDIEIVKKYGELPLIDCYPGKLNQVFMNLFNNAIHAMSGIQRPKIITIETEALKASIAVKISDTGSGVPEAIRNKIFEPFFTTKDVGEGTGLGLSIVYGIIKNHQGSIKVESKANEGSTFIITLPVALTKEV
jgi:two-component system, NtrC family, sensor kinase